MDARITAVLGTYHGMIDEERSRGRGAPGHADEGEEDRRLRAVGPQTSQFINILARSLRAPVILELGTSFGYSGIWLAEAARATGGRLVTMELHAHKTAFAREMSEKAGLSSHVEFLVGDAVRMIADLPEGIDFVLVDLWKDLYLPCLQAFVPKLNPGAIVVADNIAPHREDIRDYVQAIRTMPGMASLPVPVGQGLEISRYRAA